MLRSRQRKADINDAVRVSSEKSKEEEKEEVKIATR